MASLMCGVKISLSHYNNYYLYVNNDLSNDSCSEALSRSILRSERVSLPLPIRQAKTIKTLNAPLKSICLYRLLVRIVFISLFNLNAVILKNSTFYYCSVKF